MTGGVLALLEAGVDPDFAAFERAEARRALEIRVSDIARELAAT